MICTPPSKRPSPVKASRVPVFLVEERTTLTEPHRTTFSRWHSILCLSHCSLEGVAQFLRLEPKRTRFRLIRNASRGIDEIEPVGPPRISSFCGVSEFVDDSRNFDSQSSHASPCDQCALFFILWTRQHNLVFYIALHLPYVARVRLGDVHDQEVGLILKIRVELVERGNLPAKRRSRVAAENKNHGPRLRGHCR